jgi:hypothetical protein
LQANAEKREKKFAQMRVVADDAVARSNEENKALRKLRKELSKLESTVATREAQLAQLRAATENPSSAAGQATDDAPNTIDEEPISLDESPTSLAAQPEEALKDEKPKIKLVEEETYDRDHEIVPDTGIVLRTNNAWSQDKLAEKISRRPKKGYYSRDTIVAAALAALVVIFYPIVMQYLPPSLQLGVSNGPVETTEAELPEVPVQNYATTIGAVNFRAGPSTAANVLSTLQAGMQVIVVEESGNWTLVRLEGEGETAEPQEGWVSSTFLEGSSVADDSLADTGTDTGGVAAFAQTGGE